MSGDSVFLHQFKEVIRDLQTDLALAFNTTAYGVGAGIENAVFAGHGVLEKQMHDAGFFVKENVFGFTFVKFFHFFDSLE